MRARCSRRPAAVRTATAGVAALGLLACTTLTVPQEQQLGDQFELQARNEFRFLRDDVVNRYVEDIGQKILRAAGPQPFSYTFDVIEDDDINAFAGPAGHIYIHTGTILKARNVSELAGVIGHEIGHVVERHVAENYSRQRTASLGHQVLVIGASQMGGGNVGQAADILGGLGMTAVLNTFGREAEREADDFAVAVLPKAGYDPDGLPSFFETLVREGGPSPPVFLSSHPAPEDRLEATRLAIEQLPPRAGLRATDGGRLEIIQRRILLLTGQAR